MALGGAWGILSLFLAIEYVESEFLGTTKGILATFPHYCTGLLFQFFAQALSLTIGKNITIGTHKFYSKCGANFIHASPHHRLRYPLWLASSKTHPLD